MKFREHVKAVRRHLATPRGDLLLENVAVAFDRAEGTFTGPQVAKVLRTTAGMVKIQE